MIKLFVVEEQKESDNRERDQYLKGREECITTPKKESMLCSSNPVPSDWQSGH